MYNRYVPQADGSYSRRSMPDRAAKPQRPAAKPSDPPRTCSQEPAPCPARKPPKPQSSGSGGLFQRCFPNGLDTEDLIIILLLLLIAGDCREDQSFALLTLGLYLFM